MKNTEMKNKVCRISSELDEKYAVEDENLTPIEVSMFYPAAIFLN